MYGYNPSARVDNSGSPNEKNVKNLIARYSSPNTTKTNHKKSNGVSASIEKFENVANLNCNGVLRRRKSRRNSRRSRRRRSDARKEKEKELELHRKQEEEKYTQVKANFQKKGNANREHFNTKDTFQSLNTFSHKNDSHESNHDYDRYILDKKPIQSNTNLVSSSFQIERGNKGSNRESRSNEKLCNQTKVQPYGNGFRTRMYGKNHANQNANSTFSNGVNQYQKDRNFSEQRENYHEETSDHTSKEKFNTPFYSHNNVCNVGKETQNQWTGKDFDTSYLQANPTTKSHQRDGHAKSVNHDEWSHVDCEYQNHKRDQPKFQRWGFEENKVQSEVNSFSSHQTETNHEYFQNKSTFKQTKYDNDPSRIYKSNRSNLRTEHHYLQEDRGREYLSHPGRYCNDGEEDHRNDKNRYRYEGNYNGTYSVNDEHAEEGFVGGKCSQVKGAMLSGKRINSRCRKLFTPPPPPPSSKEVNKFKVKQINKLVVKGIPKCALGNKVLSQIRKKCWKLKKVHQRRVEKRINRIISTIGKSGGLINENIRLMAHHNHKEINVSLPKNGIRYDSREKYHEEVVHKKNVEDKKNHDCHSLSNESKSQFLVPNQTGVSKSALDRNILNDIRSKVQPIHDTIYDSKNTSPLDVKYNIAMEKKNTNNQSKATLTAKLKSNWIETVTNQNKKKQSHGRSHHIEENTGINYLCKKGNYKNVNGQKNTLYEEVRDTKKKNSIITENFENEDFHPEIENEVEVNVPVSIVNSDYYDLPKRPNITSKLPIHGNDEKKYESSLQVSANVNHNESSSCSEDASILTCSERTEKSIHCRRKSKNRMFRWFSRRNKRKDDKNVDGNDLSINTNDKKDDDIPIITKSSNISNADRNSTQQQNYLDTYNLREKPPPPPPRRKPRDFIESATRSPQMKSEKVTKNQSKSDNQKPKIGLQSSEEKNPVMGKEKNETNYSCHDIKLKITKSSLGASLLSDICAGGVELKKVTSTENSSNEHRKRASPQLSLMDQIKQGAQLKRPSSTQRDQIVKSKEISLLDQIKIGTQLKSVTVQDHSTATNASKRNQNNMKQDLNKCNKNMNHLLARRRLLHQTKVEDDMNSDSDDDNWT